MDCMVSLPLASSGVHHWQTPAGDSRMGREPLHPQPTTQVSRIFSPVCVNHPVGWGELASKLVPASSGQGYIASLLG